MASVSSSWCMSMKPPPSSSSPSPSPSPSLSPFRHSTQVTWPGKEGSWRRHLVLGMACMMITLQNGEISLGLGPINEGWNVGSAEYVVESKKGSVQWSNQRKCQPWHINSLETIVPENLPRPSAHRRWERVYHSQLDLDTAAPAVQVLTNIDNKCFTITMVGARMYGRLHTLVPMLILLTTVSLAVDVTYFKTVDLTLIPSAVKNGAVCLDGSPPAYHIDRGVGDGAHNWLVHIEGGGWCDTTENCLNRTKNIFGLGSSKIMQAKNFTGVLSDNQQLNPDFYNWNRVFVRYCDGASFTGNSFDPVNKLYYKGAKVFSAIVKDLLGKGMSNATNALITGCSAGGLSAILNCDKFRSFLPKHTNVKCASDAAYFLHVKDVFGEYNYANFYDRIVKLHGSTKNLPRDCTSTMRPRSLCFYPQYIVPHIETPLFLINSAYDAYQIGFILAPSINNLPQSWERCKNDTTTCSQDQIDILKGFRSEFLGALPKLGNASFRGMFISSCLAHCQSQLQLNWDSDPGFRLEEKNDVARNR